MYKIISKIGILSFLLTACLSNYALAKNNKDEPEWISRIIPVYDFLVVAQTPADWQLAPVHSEGDGNFYLTEFLPKGQTVKNWEEMISISGYKNMKAGPRQYFSSLYMMTEKICGKENTAAQVIKEIPNALVAILMCGKPSNNPGFGGLQKDQGEIILYRIYKKDNSLYSIFHSWRGKAYSIQDPDDKNMPTTIKNIGERISASNATLICNRKAPQGKCKDMVKLSSER